MTETISIGVDIGGDKSSIGLVKSIGTLLNAIRVPVLEQLNPEQVSINICTYINTLIQSIGMNMADISFFGVGLPVTLDIN